MYGSDAAYANSRLQETVIRTKSGNPIYVKNVRNTIEGPKVSYYTVKDLCQIDKRNKLNKMLLKNVDCSPVPLGFLNLGWKDVAYSVRVPMREDWRQGLRPRTLKYIWRSFGNFNIPNVPHIPWLPFYNCCKNIYPSYDEVVEKLKKENNCYAFHRKLCLERSGGKTSMIYKSSSIAEVRINGEYELLPNFEYMKEMIQEILHA